MKASDVTPVLRELGSYHYDVETKQNSDHTWSLVSCPLAPYRHNGGRDKNPSFSVSTTSGESYCRCFACGFSGTLSSLIWEVFKNGGIAEETKDSLLKFVEQKSLVVFDTEAAGTYVPELPSFLTQYLSTPHPYFYSRGLNDEDIYRWRLGYSPELQRVLLPHFSQDGTLLAVYGRDVTGQQQPKYMVYPKNFPRGKHLFGSYFLAGNEECLLVTEGPIDTIIARRYLPNRVGVVAIGTAIPTKAQLRQIANAAPEICVALDNDSAGSMGKERLVNYLLGRNSLTQLDFGGMKDVAEMGSGILEVFDKRVPVELAGELMGLLSNLYQTP